MRAEEGRYRVGHGGIGKALLVVAFAGEGKGREGWKGIDGEQPFSFCRA